MQEFKRRDVPIQAEQFFPEERPWPEGVHEQRCRYRDPESEWIVTYLLNTPSGPAVLSSGDWIVTAPDGTREVCRAESFAQLYEAA